jgi:hypothetical protein
MLGNKNLALSSVGFQADAGKKLEIGEGEA